MKTLLLVLAIALAVEALTEEQKKKIEEYMAECVKESKVDEETLKEAAKGVFSDDPKLKMHALCVTKKAKLQDEKGEVRIEYIKAKLNEQMKNEEQVKKLVEKCVVVKEKPEETAFEMWKCFYKNLSKDVSLV